MSKTEKASLSLNREIYIDLLRIAATFSVIMLHVSASRWVSTPVSSFDWKIMAIYDCMVRWVIPVFIMISGVFHLRPNKVQITFRDEMKIIFRKIFRLICAVIFWGILYNGINIFLLNGNTSYTWYDLIKVFMLMPFSPPWYHLWFLYVLIGLYILTPIFRSFVTYAKKVHIEYFLMLFFIFGLCLPLINIGLRYILASDVQLYFSIAELSGYIGYYIAGYYFVHYNVGSKIKTAIYLLAILSLIVTITGTIVASIFSNKAIGILMDYLLPNTMCVAYAVFLLFQDIYAKRIFSEKMKKIILQISGTTFGIYLIHALILSLFGKMGIHILLINPIMSIPIISVMAMIISYIVILLIKKIPILRKCVI